MGGVRICGLCVFCFVFNFLINFFFLVIIFGVIIKREFNLKIVLGIIFGELIILD